LENDFQLIFFSFIDDNQDHPALPMSFDMTTFEDVSLYSCTQYDFMKTADEFLSSATFVDCTIDQNRVTLHEIIMEGIFWFYLLLFLLEISHEFFKRCARQWRKY
jgi:hypothetical protein